MTLASASAQKIATDFGLVNVDLIAAAAHATGLPFRVACALIEKESGGRNVYGHDKGGALSGFELEVNEHNYAVFRWMVFEQGMPSNGVGPCQITWKGFFLDMEKKGLKPWLPLHNVTYGFGLLSSYYKSLGSWVKAGELYNGAEAYGLDLKKKIAAWKERLNP